ncbi:unnamed protein product [Symbiodinium natans]|uniref:Uncharacterized protein n=1 Tax=Symbiodinium natans TaxID=878477 RepID=A0A812I7X3_9DINO|nr:unnamed protein product [Symbiodinium natans]
MSLLSGSQDDENRPLRSKGLLPAIGVGAAVYWITGIASMTTLGLVGIGAGVGYGVGSWIADKMQKKGDAQNKVQMDQLPWAVQVALQHWQEFVTRQAAGRQLSPADVDAIWAQFEQYEPTHAANARALVRGSSAAAASEPLSVLRCFASRVHRGAKVCLCRGRRGRWGGGQCGNYPGAQWSSDQRVFQC